MSSVMGTASRAYQKARDRAKARSAIITLAGQDIAPVPPMRNMADRARADDDFRFFCETYFPHLFRLEWSQDHLRVIAKIERVVRHRETLAVAMPRGSGKTTLCQIAVVWAILSGRHHFVMLIAAGEDEADKMLDNVKTHLSSNERLLADYPEAIYPIRCLDGESRRCAGQRYYGVLTRIEWSAEQIVMPTIPGSRSSGAVIQVKGITGAIRGALYVKPDGTQVRPSLVICDDPQTDQSARSLLQTDERLSIINGALRGLTGPGEQTAIIIPCTVIRPGDLADQLLNRQDNPDWHGERTKMVYAWPTNTKLWSEYSKLREDSLRNDGDGSESTDFYSQHRGKGECQTHLGQPRPCDKCECSGTCMDAGAVLAWPARHKKDELSALQHAVNLRLKVKDPAFFAEYQNEPLSVQTDDEQLSAFEIAAKVNGESRGHVPTNAAHLTAFIDVHDKALYWMVCAWGSDFSGWVVDYGTFPDQRRTMFSLKEVKATLGRHYPGKGREGAIHAGVADLAADLLGREWVRTDGSILQIARCLVDSGYVPDLIFSAIRRSGRLALLMPSKGIGLGPDAKPFSQYVRKPGEQYGLHWRIPSTRGTRELPAVNIDTNYWKSFIAGRLLTAAGDGGSLTLFGIKGTDHRLLAEHLTSECRTRTQGRNRIVDVWKLKPTQSDNHWWDCLVGCAVAASMLGSSLPGAEIKDFKPQPRQRLRLSEMQRRTA